MLVTAVMFLALAAPKTPAPPPSALISPVESARYALTHGCLAAARQRTKLANVRNPFIVEVDKARGLYMMRGAGQVVMSDSPPQVGCYVRVGQGDPAALRRMTLDLLAAEGPTRPFQDSGPGSYNSAAPMRQEGHCVKVGGRPMLALLSTAKQAGGAPLQVSLLEGQDMCPAK